MREIKFRAWYKKEKRILRWGSEIINIDHHLNISSIANGLYGRDELILMQYTGLKDKTGKEIYEGDIVKVPISDGSFYFDSIVWDPEFGSWATEVMDNMGDCFGGYEIVGNIYENPELVKEK